MYKDPLYYTSAQKDGTINFRFVIPRCLRGDALRFAHEQVGHQGQKKTLRFAETYFYWCNMITDIIDSCKRCPLCQQIKGSSGIQQKYKELPALGQPLDRIGIDLTDMTAGQHGMF